MLPRRTRAKAMARPTQEEVEAEIAGLPALSLEALRERWRSLYGNPAPRSLRRGLLIRAVAYQLQVKAFGGLSAATKKKLREIAVAAREGRFDPAVIGPRAKPGTRLIRVWQGETHSVLVLEDGFEWNGTRYRSLSLVAKTITGTNWNGWTFFGVKRPGSPPGGATASAGSMGRSWRRTAHACGREAAERGEPVRSPPCRRRAPMRDPQAKATRCAIYTRKSSEEGLP